jgi:O-antigen/teichoic acid export membrane protein
MNGLYKKASFTFLIKILGLGIAFVFQVILGRLLEPETYGEFTMFVTFITLLSIISVIGMDRNLIKEVAKDSINKKLSNSWLYYSFKVSLILFVLISLFVYFFPNYISISSNTKYLFILMLLFKIASLLLDGFLQGAGFVVKVTSLNILLNNFLKIILFFIFYYFGFNGLSTALYAFIVSEMFTLFIRSVIIKSFLGSNLSFKENLTTGEKKLFIKYSVTMALITSIGLLLQNVDKIMISNLLDYNSVGIYKVAQNYVVLIGVFITPFVAFWPVISKLYSDNKILEIEIEMKKIVTIVTYLVIPMFFIFLFASENLLLIFGESYVSREAKIVLIVLSFSFLIDAISGPIGSILTMTNYAKYVLVNNIISLTLNIVLNYIFIKMFGIIGVAVATGLSIIVNNLLSIIQVKKLLGIFSYDFRNLRQIISLSILNYIICEVLMNTLNIDNTYLYLLIFGCVMYIINGLLLIIIYRRSIKNFIMNRRLM